VTLPWVRFDDQYPIHRKVDSLSDPAFRLLTSAIFWCARNLTDGHVPEADLDVAKPRKMKRPDKFVPELLDRELWHEAGSVCQSKKCPANPANPPARANSGWLIHDYFDYQPTKTEVLTEREKNAERQRRYRERHAESRSGSNGVSNGVTAPVSNGTPSRPVPSRRDGSALSEEPEGDQSVRAGARTREAIRWLNHRYGLTDDESAQVIAEVQARAREPVRALVPYLASMADGHLADIVAAVMDTGELREQPPPVIDDTPVELRHTYRDDGFGACADCRLPAENRRHQEAS
jgi:hypothetical protein